jgi:UDP-glucuronate 4-epimerase
MKVLLTGHAGFIGCELALRLLAAGHQVYGIDNLNAYYNVALKRARLARLQTHANFVGQIADIADAALVNASFAEFQPDVVVHLAAQAGVRYSLDNPQAYISSNIVGFLNILEACRHYPVQHLIFASTSSVYGANTEMPFSESQSTEHPLTLYAASKKANEMMAHSYAHLFAIPCTGLRFFTVYGPWGRPDMALFKFARAILKGEKISLYNFGKHRRSFTYVSDIVEGIVRLIPKAPTPLARQTDKPCPPSRSAVAPYQIFNIGNAQSVPLLDYLDALEKNLGKSSVRELLPLQPGDAPDSEASVQNLFEAVGYQPLVQVPEGIAHFVDWLKAHPEFLDA